MKRSGGKRDRQSPKREKVEENAVCADDGSASRQDDDDRKPAANLPVLGDRVPARSRPDSPASSRAEEFSEGKPSAVAIGDGSTVLDEAAAPTPSLHLDKIWQEDLDSVDLPVYVKAHTTTISFPEKVSFRSDGRFEPPSRMSLNG